MSTASFIARFSRKVVPPALLISTPIAATYYYYNQQHDQQTYKDVKQILSHSTSSISSSFVSYSEAQQQQQQQIQKQKSIFQSLESHPAGKYISKLPTISADEIRKTKSNSSPAPIYVTFRDGVYDISEFSDGHPGGDQILLAAGGPLEKYWNMYPQHATSFVLDMLEELRVGNLKKDQQWINEHESAASNDNKKLAYEHDPKRHPAMIVQSTAPYTAEPPPIALVSSHRTPNDLFYVRNHMPVPVINPDEYQLNIIDHNGKQLKSFSLNDLKTKFQKVTVPATVQCAGNRRNELGRVKKVKGGGWEIGAISNADWTGVKLSDVITHAYNEMNKSKVSSIELISSKYEDKVGRHICFEGLDEDPVTGVVYAASVPMDIMRRHNDNIILAYEMNGETLPRDHGYPIRVVIPGVVGARHVKWLGNVVLSDKESESHWQKKDYRSFSPDVDWNNVNFEKAPSIQEMPVVSAICTHGVDKDEGIISLKGYAWSGDGKEIIRVDVSIDGGETWTGAELLSDDDEYNEDCKNRKRNEVYDWKIWGADIKLPKGFNNKKDNIQLVCKAIDSAYNSQPDGAANVWNLRGLLNNCWHRVDVLFSSSSKKEEGERQV